MATAEFAVALPALALVVLCSLGGLGAAIDQVRCVDSARLAARSLARGDAVAAATAAALSAAPAGAAVDVTSGSDRVAVVVSVRRALPGLGLGWTIRASASAAREQVPP